MKDQRLRQFPLSIHLEALRLPDCDCAASSSVRAMQLFGRQRHNRTQASDFRMPAMQTRSIECRKCDTPWRIFLIKFQASSAFERQQQFSLRGAGMLYIFNRNNRVHISWNATEKRNAPSNNAKSGVASALSFIWTRSAG
jgi:hypothetical protein